MVAIQQGYDDQEKAACSECILYNIQKRSRNLLKNKNKKKVPYIQLINTQTKLSNCELTPTPLCSIP